MHNAYLEVLAEGGLPTLIAFLAFLAGSWQLAARARRRFEAAEDRDGLRMTAAVQASLVVAIVSASFLSVQMAVPDVAAQRPGGGPGAAAARAHPVKVALVTSLHRGGPLEHAILLARDLVRAGVDVRVVAAGPETRRALRGGRSARRGACRSRGRSTRPAPSACIASCAAPMSCTRTTGAAGCGCGSARARGALRVHTIHGLPEPYLDDTRPGLRARLAYEGLERALPTDVIVTPSQGMARLLAERLGYGNLAVIPNGVDVPPEPLPRGELVGALSLFEPVKGLDVLIDAVPIVLARRPQTRFALFGTGHARGGAARSRRRAAGGVPRLRARRRGAAAARRVRPALTDGEQPAGAAGGAGGGDTRGGDPGGRRPGDRRARRSCRPRIRRRWPRRSSSRSRTPRRWIARPCRPLSDRGADARALRGGDPGADAARRAQLEGVSA